MCILLIKHLIQTMISNGWKKGLEGWSGTWHCQNQVVTTWSQESIDLSMTQRGTTRHVCLLPWCNGKHLAPSEDILAKRLKQNLIKPLELIFNGKNCRDRGTTRKQVAKYQKVSHSTGQLPAPPPFFFAIRTWGKKKKDGKEGGVALNERDLRHNNQI